MLTEQPGKPHKSLVSPFPVTRRDVDFLAGTCIPWILVLVIAAVGFRMVTGNPYLDIDEVAPRAPVFQVDINAAEWPEISQLPGVGETLASRIVAQRKTAPYSSVEQLLSVRGIGEKKMEAMRPYLLPINLEHPSSTSALAANIASQPSQNGDRE